MRYVYNSFDSTLVKKHCLSLYSFNIQLVVHNLFKLYLRYHTFKFSIIYIHTIIQVETDLQVGVMF